MELRTTSNIKSGDMFLGVPWNFLFYSILTHQLAKVSGMRAGTLYHTFGDAHIYSNHFDQVRLQLSRQPIAKSRPVLHLADVDYAGNKITSVTQYTAEDVSISGYLSHDFISAPVAV